MEKTTDTTADFSLWKRISKQRREAAEQYRLKVLDEIWNALNILFGEYQWDDLYIFGSVIRPGGFSESSDVDIGVRGLDKFLHYKFVADLSTILNRDVDVVRFEDCTFAKTIMNRGIQWTKAKLRSF